MQLFGVDFTSTPSRRKAITVAAGRLTVEKTRQTSQSLGLEFHRVELQSLQRIEDWQGFEEFLRQPGPWLGVFDFPFSLPRELVEALNWPTSWTALTRHVATMSRSQLRGTFKAFCDARPAGSKFAHRQTDLPAGSSPSMKWVNPPVAYMYHEGAPRLLRAGVSLPGITETLMPLRAQPSPRSKQAKEQGGQRIALEGYPGYWARLLTTASYKSDEAAKQTPERAQARQLIVDGITQRSYKNRPATLAGLVLGLTAQQKSLLINDGSADWLDACLCLLSAGWAALRSNYGLPNRMDPLEGWIVGVPHQHVE